VAEAAVAAAAVAAATDFPLGRCRPFMPTILHIAFFAILVCALLAALRDWKTDPPKSGSSLDSGGEGGDFSSHDGHGFFDGGDHGGHGAGGGGGGHH
jgi:hypothetical protein